MIDVADRRRARVAAGGDIAARRLLGGPAALRLAGSDDPGLDVVLRHAGAAVATVGARGSFHGLTRIWRGTADAAAIHLRHRSGTHNSPFARTLLRGRQPAIIHLWRREQGLLTPEGNPGHVRGPADLRPLRVARRSFGTGTRVLLDRLLTDAGIPPASVTGPDAGSHLEVAMTVASGQADTGLGVRAAATALDLGFVPVTWEEFDIVLSGAALPAAEPLIAALRDPRRAGLACARWAATTCPGPARCNCWPDQRRSWPGGFTAASCWPATASRCAPRTGPGHTRAGWPAGPAATGTTGPSAGPAPRGNRHAEPG